MVTSVQLAARGRPSRAPTWAMTSAPRSLPVPMTTAGCAASTSWAMRWAQASGA